MHHTVVGLPQLAHQNGWKKSKNEYSSQLSIRKLASHVHGNWSLVHHTSRGLQIHPSTSHTIKNWNHPKTKNNFVFASGFKTSLTVVCTSSKSHFSQMKCGARRWVCKFQNFQFCRQLSCFCGMWVAPSKTMILVCGFPLSYQWSVLLLWDHQINKRDAWFQKDDMPA